MYFVEPGSLNSIVSFICDSKYRHNSAELCAIQQMQLLPSESNDDFPRIHNPPLIKQHFDLLHQFSADVSF
jgi:hypothetical protein